METTPLSFMTDEYQSPSGLEVVETLKGTAVQRSFSLFPPV